MVGVFLSPVEGVMEEPVIAGIIHRREITIEIITTIALAILILIISFLLVTKPIIARITAMGKNRIFNNGIIPMAANTIDRTKHIDLFFLTGTELGSTLGAVPRFCSSFKLLPQLGQNFAFSSICAPHFSQYIKTSSKNKYKIKKERQP